MKSLFFVTFPLNSMLWGDVMILDTKQIVLSAGKTMSTSEWKNKVKNQAKTAVFNPGWQDKRSKNKVVNIVRMKHTRFRQRSDPNRHRDQSQCGVNKCVKWEHVCGMRTCVWTKQVYGVSSVWSKQVNRVSRCVERTGVSSEQVCGVSRCVEWTGVWSEHTNVQSQRQVNDGAVCDKQV